MNTNRTEDTITDFTGSELFAWINLTEPTDDPSEADMDLAVLAEIEIEEAAEQEMLAAEYERELREEAFEWAVVKSAQVRGGW